MHNRRYPFFVLRPAVRECVSFDWKLDMVLMMLMLNRNVNMYFAEMDHHVPMEKSSLQHSYNFHFKTFCRMLYIERDIYIYTHTHIHTHTHTHTHAHTHTHTHTQNLILALHVNGHLWWALFVLYLIVGCGTYRAEEKCKHGLCGETQSKETIWKTQV